MNSLKNIFLNYLGQLRVYSLVDFVLLLIALKTSTIHTIGAISLWIGFLAYLEWRHAHSNRLPIPAAVWVIFFSIGLFCFPLLFSIGFIILSVVYAEKIGKYFGIISPLIRGLQTFFIASAISGVSISISFVASLAIGGRNLLGDFRDTIKDRQQGLKTIPVVLGIKNDVPYIHLAGVLSTTFLWWSWTSLSLPILLGFWIIEIGTYNITSR